jgi:purine-binding chemotaxis protein CheW
VGLLVEGVSDIIELDDGDRQATPDMGDGQGGVIAGIFAVDGAMISLLDLDSLLPPDRSRAVDGGFDAIAAA